MLETEGYTPQTEMECRLPAQLPASFGRYRLLKLLGRGGMGVVYLAQDTQLDRPVALKIPLFSAGKDAQALVRFQREARAAATLLHPHVCPVYDVGEVDGVPYLTMGYIEGKALAEWGRSKSLTPRQAALLVRKLALALHEAHKKGIVHRDLKPSNIMIDMRGEPMIMDFGLARRTSSEDAQLTQTGVIIGTPAYMAPEQVRGDVKAIGPACDIYSLGVILYELVSGRLPFSGDAMSLLSQVLLTEPPPPSQVRVGVDRELEAICLRAMAKKVEDRYESMADLARALFDYLRGKTLAPEPKPPAPAPAPEVEARPAREDSAVRRVSKVPPPTPPPAPRLEPEVSTRKPRRLRRSENSAQSVPVWLWLAAGAAAFGLLVLACGIFYRATSYGTVRIDVPDAAGPVEMTVDGEPGHHPGEVFRLRAGQTHVVEVTPPGQESVVHEFSVYRGDNPPVFIELQPKAAARIVPARPEPQPPLPPPPMPRPELGWPGGPGPDGPRPGDPLGRGPARDRPRPPPDTRRGPR